jgi:hypothetical protein
MEQPLNYFELSGQMPVFEPVGLVRGSAETFLPVRLIF